MDNSEVRGTREPRPADKKFRERDSKMIEFLVSFVIAFAVGWIFWNYTKTGRSIINKTLGK
jgi:hypothetical protein